MKIMNKKEKKLAVFADEIQQETARIRNLPSKQGEEAQIKLSIRIGEGIRDLMALGFSINAIQDSILAGMEEPSVKPTLLSMDEDYLNKEVQSNFFTVVCMVMLEEKKIHDFMQGEVKWDTFFEMITTAPQQQCLFSELLDLFLGNDELTSGEIIADSEGEALILQYLEIKNEEGPSGVISEPMVYKNEIEVCQFFDFLQNKENQNWNKIKKELNLDEELLSMVEQEFLQLKQFYQEAAKQKLSIVIYICYE